MRKLNDDRINSNCLVMSFILRTSNDIEMKYNHFISLYVNSTAIQRVFRLESCFLALTLTFSPKSKPNHPNPNTVVQIENKTMLTSTNPPKNPKRKSECDSHSSLARIWIVS